MELFKLKGTISVDNSEANSEIDETTNKFASLGGKMSKGLATVAKVGAAAVAAAGTAIIAVTKQAIESYSEYEQLVGGVDTLFKDSSGVVQEYAANAYRTAGLSANQYMETVTSFSASLLQSLGGNTAEAAKIADMAITDMSDNANKMGSDMSSIQDAYQGFAKQNYTMLDNLKLGYGGTQSEMQRLIDDANKVKEAMGETGDLTIESFADVAEAIHIIQTEMGITGTTAKEASTTIQGSISSAKAAWENWLTALGDSNADIKAKTDELIDSVGVAVQNLLPVFKQVMTSLGEALATKLPELFTQAATLVVSNLPQIIALGLQLILALINGIGQGFDQLCTMMDEWLYNSITVPFNNKMAELGQAINEKWTGFRETIRYLLEFIKTDIEESWESIKAAVVEKCTAIYTAVSEKFQAVKDAISQKVEAAKTTVSTVFSNIQSTISEKVEAAKSKVSSVFESIKSEIEEKINAARDTVESVVEKIKKAFDFTVQFKIKLPKISVTGGVAPYGIGGQGSLPKFSVDWFKKGGVLMEPTAFGLNLATGNIMAGGEAGPEAVAPIDVLQNYVAEAVAGQNAGVLNVLEQILLAILALDENMGGNLKKALDGTKLSINNREFARLVKGVT